MRYIIASKEKASEKGFLVKIHRTNDTQVILNEKEVMNNRLLSGTLEERCEQLDGMDYSEKDMLHIINDWKK